MTKTEINKISEYRKRWARLKNQVKGKIADSYLNEIIALDQVMNGIGYQFNFEKGLYEKEAKNS
jgi:hypothetical protein